MEIKHILYGASGHAKVVFEIAQALSLSIDKIIDDHPNLEYELFFKQKIFKPAECDLDKTKVIFSIGNNLMRKKLSLKFEFEYFSVSHPSAIISTSATIKKGTVVMPGAIINADAIIGNHCIINSGAIVEHDCIIEDFSHVSPNASIAGGVSIGEGTQVGIGAQIIQGVKIGKWVVIGAGTVVIKDLPDFAVVVGNPARIIKFKQNLDL